MEWHVCDAQTSSNKIFTSLEQTAAFLNAIGNIYRAFSVHKKHLSYRRISNQEAIGLVSCTLQFVRGNKDSIMGEVANFQDVTDPKSKLRQFKVAFLLLILS